MKAHRLVSGLLVCLLIGFGLQDCSKKKEAANEHLVRGLRTYKVAARAESRLRRFPSILQPADLSVLSFEIAGQLKAINLQVGQKVQLGEPLAEIDPRSLQAQVEQANAGVQQAQATVDNADGDFQRKQELLRRVLPPRLRSISRTPICSPRGRNSTRHVISSNWLITTSTAASCSLHSAAPSPASK